MGFLVSDAEYFMDPCMKYHISGKLLTLGRQDVWLTEDQFNNLLQKRNYGRQTDRGFLYKDKEIARKVAAIVEQGQEWGHRLVSMDRQGSRELAKQFTAEGRSFSHFAAKLTANSSAFFLDEA